jgi:hypothetical protein
LQKPNVLVGRSVTVRDGPQPEYFTEKHRAWIGRSGRVHAVVAGPERDNPLVKVGFDEGTQIVFYRLAELDVDAETPLENPKHHGERGSHLPKRG